jgi:Tol biopolymer transport system component
LPLQPGTRLGPYEILSAIGEGGMGQVYKARDTRLDRTVAIKVLPDALAADPQFRDRFDREARAISQLDHPNICALHDVGRQDGTAYLVMQFLDGETLDKRIARSSLPLPEALTIAVQVASALEKAHRAGIVHRDLKPGNIMLLKTGPGSAGSIQAKLLDFGLAKTGGTVVAGSGMSMLPTTPAALTAQGTILGTFQYMSPEQLEGEEADARTDIFAFGAVVYEMVTGRKAFEGKSQASLIGAILHEPPAPIASTIPIAPPALDHVVARCLAKDAEDRWQSISDVMRELKWIAEGGAMAQLSAGVGTAGIGRTAARERAAWAIAGVLLVGLGALLAAIRFGYVIRPQPDGSVVRAAIEAPDATTFTLGLTAPSRFALSPDGLRIAAVATGADRRSLIWIRALDQTIAEPLQGTDGASGPFWSPDGRSLGFFAQGKLKRIDLAGGPPTVLADATLPGRGYGGSWNRDGTILFSPKAQSGLARVSANGGSSVQVTEPDSAVGERGHEFPSFLPDGRHFLYVARGTPSSPAKIGGIYVASLDSREHKLLMSAGSNMRYAQEHLLFLRGATLLAQRFDVARLELTGEPFPLAEKLDVGGLGGEFGAFSVSETGLVAYQSSVPDLRTQLTWFDRSGKQLGNVGDPVDQISPDLSPDGSRVAVSILDSTRNSRDIWLYDLKRDGLRQRFTFDPADEFEARWSPGGDRIAFDSSRNGPLDIYVKLASGAGTEDVLLADAANNKYVTNWSSDGRFLLYYTGNGNASTGNDLWALPLAAGAKPTALAQSPASEQAPRLSPDGRWVAYMSNESGRAEVWVIPFAGAAPEAASHAPEVAGKWQVSTNGGTDPCWRRDSKELFFVSPDNKLMAVSVDVQGAALRTGVPQPLFEVRRRTTSYRAYGAGSSFDVSADGQRFLVNVPVASEQAAPITLLLNWPALQPK